MLTRDFGEAEGEALKQKRTVAWSPARQGKGRLTRASVHKKGSKIVSFRSLEAGEALALKKRNGSAPSNMHKTSSAMRNDLNEDDFEVASLLKEHGSSSSLRNISPVKLQTASLVTLTIILIGFALHWLRPVLVPLVIAVAVSYAFIPILDLLTGK